MLRHERRLLIDCLIIGTVLTVLVIACDAFGLLAQPENWFYDKRARACQQFTPKPTDKLVHLDIDDAALEVIGGWPWPRGRWAHLLEELQLAGANAIESDVIFSEPQDIQYLKQKDGTFVEVDNDRELAEAVGRVGNVIMPVSMQVIPRQSDAYRAMVEALRSDLEVPEQDATALLTLRKIFFSEHDVERFFEARREAMMLRFAAMPDFSDLTFEQVRARLLPKTDSNVSTGTVHVLKEQWDQFRAWRAFERLGFPIPAGMKSYFDEEFNLVPLPPLSGAAAAGACVDYPQFDGPVIRAVPLLIKRGSRVFPQMGLALACHMLNGDLRAMRIESGWLHVPRKDNPDIVIPLSPPRVSTEGRTIANLMDLPWFGGRDWKTMYDWPKHESAVRHITPTQLWALHRLREKIAQNNAVADDACLGILDLMDPSKVEVFKKNRPPLGDFDARVPEIKAILADAQAFADDFKKLRPEEVPEHAKAFLPSFEALSKVLVLVPPLIAELQKSSKAMSDQISGKAVLIGWVATAAVADFVPTSLHEKCPGVVVHGVVYNAIMTGEMWRRAPAWTAGASAGLLGLITAFAAGRFPPMRALLVAALLAAGYAALNGIVIFDYGNIIVGAAGPLLTVAIVWSGCTLTRVIIETAERARITRRFSNYVDPKIVDYVMENPQATFGGEVREMTVVFTDLVGFTAISERLGEKVVPMLNELFGELVPVIRHHNGTLNKFLGDGIMFFFNAPRSMPSHASVAVAAVLEMQQKVAEFSERLLEQGLPALSMRAGVLTAEMIVGDAGGAGAADYTVLGDAVNTAARLEPANKVTGTRIMMNGRTAELLEGQFLVRPLGRLKVVGKDEFVSAFEPISRVADATPAQTLLAERTREVVDCFIAGKFVECLSAADQMERDCGLGKLTALYRKLCERYVVEPPPDGFDGSIVLTEK